MGGKGRRRREKNFLASHGSVTRLPPPPKPNELDALPSKLRKIMQLKNQGPLQSTGEKRKGNNADDKVVTTRPVRFVEHRTHMEEKNKRNKLRSPSYEFIYVRFMKQNPKDGRSSVVFNMEEDIIKTSVGKAEDKDAITNSISSDTKKRKRKRKTVEDLRFQSLDQAAIHSRKKERKREYFQSKKKKQKKEKTDDIRGFPGREEVKFGEIVQAPPKLSLPKVLKASMDASKERLRLQAVESYRRHRGWTSRPGVQLSGLAGTPSS